MGPNDTRSLMEDYSVEIRRKLNLNFAGAVI